MQILAIFAETACKCGWRAARWSISVVQPGRLRLEVSCWPGVAKGPGLPVPIFWARRPREPRAVPFGGPAGARASVLSFGGAAGASSH